MRALLSIWFSFLLCSGILLADTIEIQGSDIVEIAMQGESIADYQIPDDYTLSLQSDYPGVSLRKDGTLIVTNKAEAGSITLIAKKGDQEILKNVVLQQSWTKSVNGAQEYQIPNVQDTRRIEYMNVISQYVPSQKVRYALYLSAVGIFIGYLYIRKKS